MAGRGGKRPGAGAPRGPRKVTIERALIAERQVAEAKAEGRKLGKEVLEEFMNLFAEMARRRAPEDPSENPADETRFVQYAGMAIDCAKELAKYQSPTFKAIAVAPAMPQDVKPTEGAVLEGKVVKLGDQRAVANLYRTIITAASK